MTGVAQLVGRHPAKRKVHFPVRAPAWVTGLVPGRGVQEATDGCFLHVSMFLSLSFSLPSSLSKNK